MLKSPLASPRHQVRLGKTNNPLRKKNWPFEAGGPSLRIPKTHKRCRISVGFRTRRSQFRALTTDIWLMTQACWKDTRCGFIWCYDQNQPDFEILKLIRKCPKLKNGRTQPKGSFQSVRLYSKAGSLWDKTPWNQPEQKWRIKILILVLPWKLTALFHGKTWMIRLFRSVHLLSDPGNTHQFFTWTS